MHEQNNGLSKLWRSRKAMLAVLATLAVLIRELTGVDIPVEKLLVQLTPVLAFIGLEGVADIVGRARQSRAPPNEVNPRPEG